MLVETLTHRCVLVVFNQRGPLPPTRVFRQESNRKLRIVTTVTRKVRMSEMQHRGLAWKTCFSRSPRRRCHPGPWLAGCTQGDIHDRGGAWWAYGHGRGGIWHLWRPQNDPQQAENSPKQPVLPPWEARYGPWDPYPKAKTLEKVAKRSLLVVLTE